MTSPSEAIGELTLVDLVLRAVGVSAPGELSMGDLRVKPDDVLLVGAAAFAPVGAAG